MPRKRPFREKNEISQTFNDGVITIYDVSDGARIGYQPVIKARKKARLHYEERILGINRMYLARQDKVDIKYVLRIPKRNISPQDIAQLHDGCWYKIDSVQSVPDVFPASLDITLVKEERTVEVIQ